MDTLNSYETVQPMRYFKITNAKENHNGFQYVDGLNVLDKPFEEKGSCVKGGLYFSNAKNILKFLSFGIYLREITFPESDPDFKMVKDPKGTKWRANKIILGKRYNLSDVSTFEFLISIGAKINWIDSIPWASSHGYLDVIKFFIDKYPGITIGNICICKASENGHSELVKFFIEKGIDPKTKNNLPIASAARNGHLDVIKILIENGVDVNANDDTAMNNACLGNHIKIIEFLINNGADKKYNYAIKYACEKGDLKLLNYLISIGYDFRINRDHPLQIASCEGHLEVVKLLVENGADVGNDNNLALIWASENNHLDVVKFLVEKGATLNPYVIGMQ